MTDTATAVVLIDMQNVFADTEQRALLGWPPIWRLREVIEECRLMLGQARAQGMPVIYTRQLARPDAADIMPSTRRLLAEARAAAGDNGRLQGARSMAFFDEIAPRPGDIVLDKPRWDAFHYTALDAILRNLRTSRLVVAGLQTNVCVESTARSALMRNFEVAVPEDAVTTDGADLHFSALNALRVLYAEVAPWRTLLAPGARWESAFTIPNYGRSVAPASSSD